MLKGRFPTIIFVLSISHKPILNAEEFHGGLYIVQHYMYLRTCYLIIFLFSLVCLRQSEGGRVVVLGPIKFSLRFGFYFSFQFSITCSISNFFYVIEKSFFKLAIFMLSVI